MPREWWGGLDCGVLGLSSGRVGGFLGVCVGLYGFLGMQGFFSHFLDLFSLLVLGAQAF